MGSCCQKAEAEYPPLVDKKAEKHPTYTRKHQKQLPGSPGIVVPLPVLVPSAAAALQTDADSPTGAEKTVRPDSPQFPEADYLSINTPDEMATTMTVNDGKEESEPENATPMDPPVNNTLSESILCAMTLEIPDLVLREEGRLFTTCFLQKKTDAGIECAVASAGESGHVRIWNLQKSNDKEPPHAVLKMQLQHGNDWIWGVAFADNYTLAATAGEDGRVVVWDAVAGKRSISMSHSNPRGGSSGSSGGQLFCAVKCVCFGHGPGGLRLATGGEDGLVQIWGLEVDRMAGIGTDVITADLQCSLDHGSGEVSSIAMSSDGSKLVSGGEDGNIKLWDVNSGGSLLLDSEHGGGWVFTVAFSTDGQKVASGGCGGHVVVWDAESCELVHYMAHGGEQCEVRCVCYASDHMSMISGGSDGFVKVWHAATGELMCQCDHMSGGGTVFAADVSVDVDSGLYTLASAGKDGCVKLWQLPLIDQQEENEEDNSIIEEEFKQYF